MVQSSQSTLKEHVSTVIKIQRRHFSTSKVYKVVVSKVRYVTVVVIPVTT